jgi:hypothetical protein
MDHENLLQELSFLNFFLHELCVSAPITSSSFIRFWHISNDRKAQEDSYEFALKSFWE